MDRLFSQPLFVAAVAFAVSFALTYVVRSFARKYGFVAKPKSDRWHKKPTALMGGVAIFIATVLVFFELRGENRS